VDDQSIIADNDDWQRDTKLIEVVKQYNMKNLC